MDRIRKINITFLITVLASNVCISYLLGYLANRTLRVFLGQVALALPAVIFLRYNKINITSTIRLKKVRPANIFLLILLSFLISPVLTFINAISMLYSVNIVSTGISSMVTDINFFVATAVFALVPAILEETVYRGIFFNEYSKVKKGSAIALSALLFGLMHGNLNQFTYAFFIGMLFCLVIEATDSIISTMIMHFCINFSSVLIIKVYPLLLGVLERMYNAAIQNGDTMTAETIISALGTDDFSMESVIDSAASVVAQPSTLTQVIASYGFSALFFGALAFLVFRTIARNAGRWDTVKNIFSRNKAGEGSEVESDLLTDATAGKVSLITMPLIIAVSVLEIMIILFELEARGIIHL